MTSSYKAIETDIRDWNVVELSNLSAEIRSQQRSSKRDEFDRSHQFLDRSFVKVVTAQQQNLLHLSMNLYVNEQDEILSQVNDHLSKCAFDFVAKYQFLISLQPDKKSVEISANREWTKWVYLLKKLAIKRRISARVLFHDQIKQLIIVLKNFLKMQHAVKHQSRSLKDDRNVLQLISAELQIDQILKDAVCMKLLDNLRSDRNQDSALKRSKRSKRRFFWSRLDADIQTYQEKRRCQDWKRWDRER